MTKLVKQPTALPLRKIIAVMVAGAVVGSVQAGLNLTWPDHPFAELLEQVDVWIQLGVMSFAGYMTKERERV